MNDELKPITEDSKVVGLLKSLEARARRAAAQPGPESPSGCTRCDGNGYIEQPDGRVAICQCRKERLLAKRLRQAGIPPRFRDKDLRNFKHGFTALSLDASRQVRLFIDKFKPGERGLMLRGGPGTGKTHLAISLLKGIVQRGFTGTFENVVNLIDAIKATFNPAVTATEGDLIEGCLDCDLLVLDDIGAERLTQWWGERMYCLINSAYERNRTLVVTTNLKLPELEQQVSPRVFSRLMEMCRLVECGDTDYRVQVFTAPDADGEEEQPEAKGE